MARKRGRSNAARAQAAESQDAGSAEPVTKKSKKINKSATTNAKPMVAERPKQKNEQSATTVASNLSERNSADAAKKKKSKKNKNKNKGASTAATEDATTGKKKVKSNEIDDLFATLKTTKQQKTIDEQKLKLAEEEAARREKADKDRLQEQIKKLEAQNTNSTAGGLNPDPRPVRYDEDGLPIYTESSLQIGKGGNTKDCPFDCWCCF